MLKNIILKPCPGGCECKPIYKDFQSIGEGRFIMCPGCEWTGPTCGTEAEAASMWNKRCSVFQSKEALIYALARIENCWTHHQDGSDLRKTHSSHLFSLIFNDLKWAITDDPDFQWSRMFLEGEEEEIKYLFEKDYSFAQTLKRIKKVEVKAQSNINDDLLNACQDMASILNGLHLGTMIDNGDKVDRIREVEDNARDIIARAKADKKT
ncbi:MAG: hypothetical protein ACTSSP_00795 [Candidatus Asgardarchaeia archaeon]